MTSDPSDLLLNALEARDRSTVERWSRLLGLGDGGWYDAPGFRQVVELIAILTVADGIRDVEGLSERQSWVAAAELLLGDDDERSTSPGDIVARRLRRWLAATRTKCPDTVETDLVRRSCAKETST